jgi:hypothetical protein
MDSDEFDPDYYIENAKMFRGPGQRVKIERSAKLAGIGIPDIIEMGIGAPISFLMDDDDSPILRSVGGSLSNYKYVDIFLAVPPGWQHHEHEMFEQSINRALGQREGQRVGLHRRRSVSSENGCKWRDRKLSVKETSSLWLTWVLALRYVTSQLPFHLSACLSVLSSFASPSIFSVSTLRTLNTILADSPRRLHLN